MEKFRIVADSAADLLSLESVPYTYAPLKIITLEKEYVDNKDLNVREMVENLLSYKGKSSTSCPNSEDWLRAFGDAEYVFCVTITGTLSGSYNSANIAKAVYEEMFPDRKVFVINSLSTGPEMKLIIEKISKCINEGKEYEVICKEVMEYTEKTGLFFMLESMKNLSNNGRVNPVVAKAAGLLGIRIVGIASPQGDLQILDKCRGRERALETIVERLTEKSVKTGKIYIGHCLNIEAATLLKEKISSAFPEATAEIYELRGLCSFYAEKGGLIIGFEKF